MKEFYIQGELVLDSHLLDAGGVGRDRRRRTGVEGFPEGSGGQGCVHRWIHGESKEEQIDADNNHLRWRRFVGYFVNAFHQNVIVWHPQDREYDAVKEGLHNLVYRIVIVQGLG